MSTQIMHDDSDAMGSQVFRKLNIPIDMIINAVDELDEAQRLLRYQSNHVEGQRPFVGDGFALLSLALFFFRIRLLHVILFDFVSLHICTNPPHPHR